MIAPFEKTVSLTEMLDAHHAHSMQCFDSEDRLASSVSRFIHEAFDAGCTCVLIATAEHRIGIEARLAAIGLDAEALAAQYRYVTLDARSTLEGMLDDGRLHTQRFHQVMGSLIRQASAGGQPVRIYTELAGVLAAHGDMPAALRLEELWNELSRHQAFSLHCGYWQPRLQPESRHTKLLHAVHSHVLPTAR